MSLSEVLAWVPRESAEADLAKGVCFDRLPVHIAIIMDGNGRWAVQRRLPRVEGHRAGIDSVRDVVEISARLGIKVLTLYAFSVENWKRPAAEVKVLMELLKRVPLPAEYECHPSPHECWVLGPQSCSQQWCQHRRQPQ